MDPFRLHWYWLTNSPPSICYIYPNPHLFRPFINILSSPFVYTPFIRQPRICTYLINRFNFSDCFKIIHFGKVNQNWLKNMYENGWQRWKTACTHCVCQYQKTQQQCSTQAWNCRFCLCYEAIPQAPCRFNIRYMKWWQGKDSHWNYHSTTW